MKRKLIEYIILSSVKLIALTSLKITALWSAIEFVIYLFKDIPFNWWSLWGFIISVIVANASLFIQDYISRRDTKQELDNIQKPPKKSRFQERLDEAMAGRNKSES